MGEVIAENTALANGKLTRERSEDAGVLVAAKLPADELTPRQPIASKAEILRQGGEALVQLSRGHDWECWKKVLPVLDIARSAAMCEAGTNEPKGRRYSDAYGRWFRCHPQFEALAKLDSGLRARLFECFANLAAIDDWRAKLEPEQRLHLNYPTTVLARWKARFDGTGAQKKRAKTNGSESIAETPTDPVATLVEILTCALDGVVAAAFETKGLDWFLKVAPADWRAAVLTAILEDEAKANAEMVTAVFAARGLQWLLKIVPADWPAQMAERVVNLQARQDQTRQNPARAKVEVHFQASQVLRQALSLVKVVDTEPITPAEAAANKNNALVAIRQLSVLLKNFATDEISIVRQHAKENHCAKSRSRRRAA